MPAKQQNPTSPGRRFYVAADRSVVDDKRPERSLTLPHPEKAGRNVRGKVTVRHRGAGHKRLLRIIDNKRDKDGVSAFVKAIEYDPGRTAHIALLEYDDGERRYILAPHGLERGARVISGVGSPARLGNCLPLAGIPVGTTVHSVEMQPGKGGQLVRGAGAGAQIMARESGYVTLRLPSGEMRMVAGTCRATVGRVGNVEQSNVRDGKAGRKRHKGWRPAVRGAAMNPVDHPHGGGEGKAPIGMDSPRSPWGQKTLGLKTRKRSKTSNKYIVRRRGSQR